MISRIQPQEGFRRLIDSFGLTQDELATAIGKSRSHVANLLRLLNLPSAVLDHVREGRLTAGHARAALACSDPAAAAQHMIKRGLSVRQAEAMAEGPKSPPRAPREPAGKAQPSADLRAVEADLTEQLGLRVSISFNGQGGTISLRYETLDQLDHIVARLGR